LIWSPDKLTWLLTRTWFEQLIKFYNEWIFILFDIDNFKSVNDTYWHDIWDIVLKQVADTIKKNIRTWDILTRFWWEEFLLYLPEVKDCNIWLSIANKIREKINEIDTKNITEWRKISVSWWIWIHNWNKNIECAIKESDNNLYKAKETWKNKICLSI